MASAPCRRATDGESVEAILSRNFGTPCVVGISAISMFSLAVNEGAQLIARRPTSVDVLGQLVGLVGQDLGDSVARGVEVRYAYQMSVDDREGRDVASTDLLSDLDSS
jgi:hypothetical protein